MTLIPHKRTATGRVTQVVDPETGAIIPVAQLRTPSLKIDVRMLSEFGRALTPVAKLERRIVFALCAHMQARGWLADMIHDGDDYVTVSGKAVGHGWRARAIECMELIFNLDESTLYFRNAAGQHHGVYLVTGNTGDDIICDWHYTDGDPDGFDACMSAFDPYQFSNVD